MQTPTDEELLIQIKAGSEPAFACLFERYRELMYMEAHSKLQSSDEAQDAVQEVFIRLWEKRKAIHIEKSLRNYLMQAVRFNSLNRLKHEAVTNKRKQKYAYLKEAIVPPAYFENAELGNHLQKAISEISPASRTAFEMLYMENKSQKEIAAEMGLSLFTVKNHIVRALKKLRQNLKSAY